MARRVIRSTIFISFIIFSSKVSLCAASAMTKNLQKINTQFSDGAQKRLKSLKKLISDGKCLSEKEQIECVNNFFNQVPYQSDKVCWGEDDYWATPTEMLSAGHADCEDYAIAKFFTLLEMGIPKEKLFLTYALTDSGHQKHMVLSYYPDEHSTPLILDNQKLDVKPEIVNKDYIPMCRFNREYFVAFDHGFEHKTPINLKKMAKWDNLTKRL